MSRAFSIDTGIHDESFLSTILRARETSNSTAKHGNNLYKSTWIHEPQKLMHGSIQDGSARDLA
jgi:hypothetical protein